MYVADIPDSVFMIDCLKFHLIFINGIDIIRFGYVLLFIFVNNLPKFKKIDPTKLPPHLSGPGANVLKIHSSARLEGRSDVRSRSNVMPIFTK